MDSIRKSLVWCLVALAALAMALLGLAAARAHHWTRAAAPPPSDGAPAIEVSPSELDFGAIEPHKVSLPFTVTNRGGGTLEINEISTSCGCTTAVIDKKSLAPGESAVVTVTYDPAHHDNATGDFTRTVYVRSNDPNQPEAQVTVKVTVLPAGAASVVPSGAAGAASALPQALAAGRPKVAIGAVILVWFV